MIAHKKVVSGPSVRTDASKILKREVEIEEGIDISGMQQASH